MRGPYFLQHVTHERYVTPPGREKSYTHMLQEAQAYWTRGEAERDRCVECERVVSADQIWGT
jgi:hypothetical protein